jgi:hypothetical protein
MIFLIKAFFAMRKIMTGRSRDHLSPEAKEVVLKSGNPGEWSSRGHQKI